MKTFIKKLLKEMLDDKSFGLPKHIDVNSELLTKISTITLNDFEILENGDNGSNKMYLRIEFNDPSLEVVSDSIEFYVQIINDFIYHPHIFLNENLENKKLGSKILKKFIYEFGHAYLSKGRTINPKLFGMFKHFCETDSNLECIESDKGVLVTLVDNPIKDQLIGFMN